MAYRLLVDHIDEDDSCALPLSIDSPGLSIRPPAPPLRSLGTDQFNVAC